MVVTESYRDLCKELDLLQDILQGLEKEYAEYFELLEGKTPHHANLTASIQQDKVTSSNPYLPPEEAYTQCARILNAIQHYRSIIGIKDDTRLKIEEGMSDCESLGGQVRYMYTIQNKSLTRISNELGYSYDYIKNVNSKVNKR